MLSTYARFLTAACAFASTAYAVIPIEVVGKDFVNSKTKERFQVIGVDYQPGGSAGFDVDADPLSNSTICLRDAALMQRLGVNTVRIYNLSPTLDHSECASIYNAAGIYMVLDVNSPLWGGSLDRTDPSGSYHDIYLQQVFGVIENFKNFPNTLAFFAGNEVINEQSVKEVPAYIRAVQRDMKDYMAKNLDRVIPVGYSAADVREMLEDTVNYFQCEDKNAPNSRSDFFGLNSYSWCGNSSYTISGYDVLTGDFRDASLPVFFSEYGCNEVQPRYFTEVEALYSEEMTQSFSGGLIYEYTQEANDYGLVKLNDNGTASLLVDYDHLMAQYHNLDMARIESYNSTQTSVKPPACSRSLIKEDGFLKSFDLPERPKGVQKMIDEGYKGAVVGKLVPVTETAVAQTIYNSDGTILSGVELKVLDNDASNTPGENTSGTSISSSDAGSGSGSGSTGSEDQTGAAPKMSTSWVMGLLSGAFVVTVSML